MLTALHESLLADQYLQWLLAGWLMTMWSAVLVVAAATLLGALLAAARQTGGPILQTAGSVYVAIFRNIPLLIQLFFWYFGVPRLLPQGVREWLFDAPVLQVAGVSVAWPSFEFLAAICGMVFYSAAYVGEDIRSGLRGVPRGQASAAAALGFTGVQILRHIILPQGLRIALPALMGQYMNIIKNTSLGMAIGLTELSYAARQVEAETFKTFQAFGVATMLYVLTIAVLEVASKRLHRRYQGIGAAAGQRG